MSAGERPLHPRVQCSSSSSRRWFRLGWFRLGWFAGWWRWWWWWWWLLSGPPIWLTIQTETLKPVLAASPWGLSWPRPRSGQHPACACCCLEEQQRGRHVRGSRAEGGRAEEETRLCSTASQRKKGCETSEPSDERRGKGWRGKTKGGPERVERLRWRAQRNISTLTYMTHAQHMHNTCTAHT